MCSTGAELCVEVPTLLLRRACADVGVPAEEVPVHPKLSELAQRYVELLQQANAGRTSPQVAYAEAQRLVVEDGAGVLWALDMSSAAEQVRFCTVGADGSRRPADPSGFADISAPTVWPQPDARSSSGWDTPQPDARSSSGWDTPQPDTFADLSSGLPSEPSEQWSSWDAHTDRSAGDADQPGWPAPTPEPGWSSGFSDSAPPDGQGVPGVSFGAAVLGWLSARRRTVLVVAVATVAVVVMVKLAGSDEGSSAKLTYTCPPAPTPVSGADAEVAALVGCLEAPAPDGPALARVLSASGPPAAGSQISRAVAAAALASVHAAGGGPAPAGLVEVDVSSLPKSLRASARNGYALGYVSSSQPPEAPISRSELVWAAERLWTTIAGGRALPDGENPSDATGQPAELSAAAARMSAAGLIDVDPGSQLGYATPATTSDLLRWLGRLWWFAKHQSLELPGPGAQFSASGESPSSSTALTAAPAATSSSTAATSSTAPAQGPSVRQRQVLTAALWSASPTKAAAVIADPGTANVTRVALAHIVGYKASGLRLSAREPAANGTGTLRLIDAEANKVVASAQVSWLRHADKWVLEAWPVFVAA